MKWYDQTNDSCIRAQKTTVEQHVNSDTKIPKNPSSKALAVKPKNLPAKVLSVEPKNTSADNIATRSKKPSADVPDTRPKNPPANLMPTEGYVIEVDGILKSEYATPDEASKAGLVLKKKFPNIQVKVYDAGKRTRTSIKLPD
jgi:hypothetical protein